MNLTCKNGKTISNSKPKCKVYFINLKYKAKQGKVNALSASCLSLLHRFSLLFVLRSMLRSALGFALRLASLSASLFVPLFASRAASLLASRFASRSAAGLASRLAPRSAVATLGLEH